jgi:hypothetical protein
MTNPGASDAVNEEPTIDADVFHGELTANRAQILVRVPRTDAWQDCTLHGQVHGPRCDYAQTLPARFALQDLGAGPTLLARTIVTDPCYWTADLPQIYDVQIELRRGAEVLAREQRMIGLRGLGARTTAAGGQLAREGKTWIPRGVSLKQLAADALPALREELLVGVTAGIPALDLLVEASRRGVYLIVPLDAALQDVPAALRQLARWPAVMMAVIHGGETLDRSLAQVAPNILLAQRVRGADLPTNALATTTLAPWASLVVADLAPADTTLPLPSCSVPVFVQRTLGALVSADEARAACDQLQRDLAHSGQFAGYLV